MLFVFVRDLGSKDHCIIYNAMFSKISTEMVHLTPPGLSLYTPMQHVMKPFYAKGGSAGRSNLPVTKICHCQWTASLSIL